MKDLFKIIVSLFVVMATSCSQNFEVTDHSFDFSATVTHDMEADEYRMTLMCNKKSSIDEYNIAFNMDGENTMTLTDIKGVTHQEAFVESFSETTLHTYVISETSVGEHIIDLTISSEYFSQEILVPFEVTRQKYNIHAEVSTVDPECSCVLLSLAKGDSKYIYNVDVQIDSITVTSSDIDFSQTPIAKISLPDTIRPCEHSVTLSVSDGITLQEYHLEYSEPLRHPHIYATLHHDKKSGFHRIRIDDNPYSIELNITSSIDLKGKSTFYPAGAESDYWWGNSHCKYLTESDTQTTSVCKTGAIVDLIDRDYLAECITDEYEISYVWKTVTNPGDGENCDEVFVYVDYTFRAYYSIISEILSIDITGEQIEGIKLIVTNDIGPMTLNGQTSASGSISITL